MKLMKIVNKEGADLINDPTNQIILRELVDNERSTSELAAKFNLPLLKLWRRMQKLQKAQLIELTSTKKVGNLEKKLYRATAAWFAPEQFFSLKTHNPLLQDAFNVYSEIQNLMLAEMAAFTEIPKNAVPMDYSLFANMYAFIVVSTKPATQAKILELKEKLAKFRQLSGY